MLSLFREYSLDVWDWIVGNRYPRQVLLESLKEPDRQFPASNLRTTESERRANLTAETRLIKRSNIAIGIWEETHPESSVCITQLKPRPRILPAYQSEHEEF